jgi:uncharacterized membrane protein YoaK (UPF0700 family)
MESHPAVSEGQPAPGRNPEPLLLLLAWAAGNVDASTFAGLGHVFTANMTGNTVLLGLALGQGELLTALRSLTALAGFILGAAAGTGIARTGPGRGTWTASATRTVLAEAVVLAVLAVARAIAGPDLGSGWAYVLIGLSGLAMGLQSAAVRHVNVAGASTTYITGTLTILVGSLVERQRCPTPSPAPPAHPRLGLLALLLLVYALAAVSGGFLAAWWPAAAFFLPLVVVALVAMLASGGP